MSCPMDLGAGRHTLATHLQLSALRNMQRLFALIMPLLEFFVE